MKEKQTTDIERPFFLLAKRKRNKRLKQGRLFADVDPRDDYNSPENQLKRLRAKNDVRKKRAIEQEMRRASLDFILAHAPKEPTMRFLRSLAERLLVTAYRTNELQRRHDLKTWPALCEFIRRQDSPSLVKLFIEMETQKDLNVCRYGAPARPSSLNFWARTFHLHIDGARQIAKKNLLSTLHDCEVCGCTEKTPCEGGCAWDKEFHRVGRFVCTRHAAVAKPLPAKKTSEHKKED